jgi:hypothetical protein
LEKALVLSLAYHLRPICQIKPMWRKENERYH